MSKRYLVKELFGPTLQGEGVHAGRPCVFLRFASCNLQCSWCDTDFAAEGARSLTAEQIAQQLVALDTPRSGKVVITGGEPALQWDSELATALNVAGLAAHMETNGTRELAAPVQWLTVSPKPQFHGAGHNLVPLAADECKVVVDDTVTATELAAYEQLYRCDGLSLQPCMDANYERHLQRAIELVMAAPRWRLGLQLHKLIGLP